MSTLLPQVEAGKFFHICNRAVGGELLFRFSKDYDYWFNLLQETVLQVAEIHAFCVLSNHYHLLIKGRDTIQDKEFSKELNRLQSIYAKKMNHQFERKGSLFISPYNRIPIKGVDQLIWAFWYIHRNPLHHGLSEDWQNYPYSSYPLYNQKQTGFLTTQFMLDLFGGFTNLQNHHLQLADAYSIPFKKLALE